MSGYTFIQPVPTGIKGQADYHGMGRVACSFGEFGTSMGMYLNQTTTLCLSPHIPGTSDDYWRHKVKVAIAFNGQDFMEETSNAYVTFVGTGHAPSFLPQVLTTLLVALFLIGLFTCCAALFNLRGVPDLNPNTISLRQSND